MKKTIMYLLLFFLLLGGCSQRIPDPEAKSAKATENKTKASERAVFRHSIKGNSIYIECFVPGVSFSAADPNKKRGKTLLYIDGKYEGEYEAAAFIVKDLPKGTHVFKLEIVDQNNKHLGIKKEFSATIG